MKKEVGIGHKEESAAAATGRKRERTCSCWKWVLSETSISHCFLKSILPGYPEQRFSEQRNAYPPNLPCAARKP
jgi:hypothetical protein